MKLNREETPLHGFLFLFPPTHTHSVVVFSCGGRQARVGNWKGAAMVFRSKKEKKKKAPPLPGALLLSLLLRTGRGSGTRRRGGERGCGTAASGTRAAPALTTTRGAATPSSPPCGPLASARSAWPSSRCAGSSSSSSGRAVTSLPPFWAFSPCVGDFSLCLSHR